MNEIDEMQDFQEMDEMPDGMIPVFMITGFLESGKTQFLNFTMGQDYFQTDENTLLIVCEEGEGEYDARFLKRNHTTMVTVDSMEELTVEQLTDWEFMYNPSRVLIEWNGMWDVTQLELPKDWGIYQQITLIDGSTFPTYYANMRPLLSLLVKNSELIICNRCDRESDELGNYKRQLRALAPNAEIILEDEQGEIREMIEEDLPYDLKKDVVKITPEAYGIWYMDAMDCPKRYKGKVFELTGMVLKNRRIPTNGFVLGRMAMACCEADMTFLGYMCKSSAAKNLKTKDWVKVRARMEYEYQKEYRGEAPILYVEEVTLTAPIKEPVTF